MKTRIRTFELGKEVFYNNGKIPISWEKKVDLKPTEIWIFAKICTCESFPAIQYQPNINIIYHIISKLLGVHVSHVPNPLYQIQCSVCMYNKNIKHTLQLSIVLSESSDYVVVNLAIQPDPNVRSR